MRTSERFWSKVRLGNQDDCWEWIARKNEHGYGTFKLDAKSQLAHRVAWTIINGPIPSGEQANHICDNPGCVNPRHLWLGTQIQNIRDRERKGRGIKGSRVGAAKLSEDIVANIRQAYAEREDILQSDLAKQFNVDPSVISLAIRGKTWQHVA